LVSSHREGVDSNPHCIIDQEEALMQLIIWFLKQLMELEVAEQT